MSGLVIGIVQRTKEELYIRSMLHLEDENENENDVSATTNESDVSATTNESDLSATTNENGVSENDSVV